MLRTLLLLAVLASPASAQTPLTVKLFPGAHALPAISAASQGIFARHGLKVEVLFTVNSEEQRSGLAKGEFQIAQAAVDNAVAMVELAGVDVVIVTGGDSSLNELIVQADIRSYSDLKGQTLLVDAPNTAYALQLKKILLMNGLKEGDRKSTRLNSSHSQISYAVFCLKKKKKSNKIFCHRSACAPSDRDRPWTD